MHHKTTSLALLAMSLLGSTAYAAGGYPQPDICDRDCWGAREPANNLGSMSGLNRAVIHHTAFADSFHTGDIEESKALVRGVQNYHMDVNGWSDIGYHFLADALGNGFEGRDGAMNSLVRGAHDGVNDQSFGFSMMGYFHSPHNQQPTEALRCIIYDMISWRIPDNFDGLGSSTYNGKETGYLAGHRDVGSTACPGDLMYDTYIGKDYEGGEAREEIYARIETGAGFLCEGGPQCCPGAPTLDSVKTTPNGVEISWQDLGEVISYQVYFSDDGESFGAPIVLPSGQTTFVDDVAPGASRYYFITALGTASESDRSDTYGIQTPINDEGRILVVDGNDRWRSQNESNGTNHDFAALAGQSISAFPFDTADNHAIQDGLVSLGDYDAVIWLLGEESTTYETLNADEQALVQNYLLGGGNLFISGAEIGWDLVERGSTADTRFYEDMLKTQYVSDDGGQYTAYAQAGGIFDGLAPLNFASSAMDVEYPDVIAPLGGAEVELYYTSTAEGDSADRFAATSYAGDYRMVNFGFPFEAIDASGRADVMERVVDFFELDGPSTGEAAHIELVKLTISTAGRDRAIAQVTVVNAQGRPLTDVTVTGAFSGDINQEAQGTTNSRGVAMLSTTPTNQNITTAEFCVESLSGNITHDEEADIMICATK